MKKALLRERMRRSGTTCCAQVKSRSSPEMKTTKVDDGLRRVAFWHFFCLKNPWAVFRLLGIVDILLSRVLSKKEEKCCVPQ